MIHRPVAVALTVLLASAGAGAWQPSPDPAARALTAAPLAVAKPFAHITAAIERPDATVLVSDITTPAIWLLDPATGVARQIGAAGAGPDPYAQPGGFYAGTAGAILVSDHSGPRALVISPDGRITGGYSTAVRGVRSSADGDIDRNRLDSRGMVYFARHGLPSGVAELPTTSDLIRLDPVKQTQDVVTKLAIPKEERLPSGDNMILTRSVIGDSADGWGVAGDGRIAVVRAAPYRVEWIAADGKTTTGPAMSYTPIPMTADDREAISRAAGTGGASVGSSRDGAQPVSVTRKFAAVKPPFFPDDVVVSPAGRVWVMRTQPFGVSAVVYDVFDGTGARVDRVQFPAGSAVVGFGPAAVYVREGTQLRKYKTR